MSNPWMEHVKKVRAKNPKMAYKDVLVKAKSSYKKKTPAPAKKAPASKKPKKTSKKEEMPAEE
jgi:hypothetical protein